VKILAATVESAQVDQKEDADDWEKNPFAQASQAKNPDP
jgi:hypothetical protein